MPNELLLTAPRAIRIAPYEDPGLGPDDVRAVAIASGISHGTELALYRGDSAFEEKHFDLDLRQFVMDAGTQPYPMRLGTSGSAGWTQSAPTYAESTLATGCIWRCLTARRTR